MREAFTLAAILLLVGVTTAGQERQVQTILFVCEHGSAKSVIAAAHFNLVAKQKGLPYRAVSRGIDPDPDIPEQIRLNCAKDGVDVETWKPHRVTEVEVREAARIVMFGCKLPFSERFAASKFVDWSDVSSPNEDYKRARSMIVDKIEAFIKILPLKGSD